MQQLTESCNVLVFLRLTRDNWWLLLGFWFRRVLRVSWLTKAPWVEATEVHSPLRLDRGLARIPFENETNNTFEKSDEPLQGPSFISELIPGLNELESVPLWPSWSSRTPWTHVSTKSLKVIATFWSSWIIFRRDGTAGLRRIIGRMEWIIK
jgi:hypothetical protein